MNLRGEGMTELDKLDAGQPYYFLDDEVAALVNGYPFRRRLIVITAKTFQSEKTF